MKKEDSNKLSLQMINPKGFVNFCNKFKVIDSNLLISIDSEYIEIRSITPTDSAFKVGKINFEEIFILPEDQKIPDKLKLGIFNIEKFSKIFQYLDNEIPQFIIYYNDADKYSNKIEIKTQSLQKVFPSAGKNLFKTMTNDQVERAFSNDGSLFKFNFDKDILTKINNLLNLESNNYFSLVYKKGMLSFIGKEFKLKFSEDVEKLSDSDTSITFNNDIFKYADRENFEVYAKDSGLLLFSKDSDLKIGLCASDVENNEDVD